MKAILIYKNLQLLITLVLFFIIMPFLNDSRISGITLTIFLSLLLFFAVIATGSESKISLKPFLMGAIVLIFNWFDLYTHNNVSIILSKLTFWAFFSYIAIILLARIMKDKEVSANTIYGASCVYLLTGVAWAFLYSLIAYLNPNAFSLPGGSETVAENIHLYYSFFDFFYFSFVTITTLGYGDIVPISRFAKILAVLESLTGQLFIAVLMARLVGLYIAQQTHIRNKQNSGKKSI